MSEATPLTKEEQNRYVARAKEGFALARRGGFFSACHSETLAWSATVADLERQLDEARERIATLRSALAPILLDMDKAKAEGRQYMPLEDKGG